jgi:hypothetical protein
MDNGSMIKFTKGGMLIFSLSSLTNFLVLPKKKRDS